MLFFRRLFTGALLLVLVLGQVAPVPAQTSFAPLMIDALSVRDKDVREVIEMIAHKSGLNIVISSGVQGQVTIFLNQVEALEALRMVVESANLAFAQDDGVVRVMSAAEYQTRYSRPFGSDKVTRILRLNFVPVADMALLLNEIKSDQGKVVVNEAAKSLIIVDVPEKIFAMEKLIRQMDVQTVTAEIALKFARAENIYDLIRALATQGVGLVECDMKQNRLVITDTPPNIEKIRRAAERLDARARQVVWQAKLVHIELNDEHLGGVDWSGILEDYRNIRLRGRYDFLDGESQDRVLSLGTIADEDFSTLLEALGTVGNVREFPLSSLSVDQPGRMRVTVHFDEPSLGLGLIREGDETESAGGSASVDLDVQAEVDIDGNITARVISPDSSQGDVPFSRASVGSVDIPAGTTVVLGGLIATEKIATIRKIPLMGDLPLVGFAFRFRNSQVRREEFVIFFSPRVAGGAAKEAKPEKPAAADSQLTTGLSAQPSGNRSP